MHIRAKESAPAEAPPPPVSIVYTVPVPDLDRELDQLRLLQEAAERHAFEADHAIEAGGNGDKDAAFNRNARTAVVIARARHALTPKKDTDKNIIDLPVVEVPRNDRDATSTGEAAGTVDKGDTKPDPDNVAPPDFAPDPESR